MNNSLMLDRSPARLSRNPASPRLGLIGPLLAMALCAGAGGCMLSVEAEVPDIEVTQHDLAFEGVPHAGLLGDVSTGMSFSQDRPGLDLPKGIDSSVQAVKVEFRAKTGISDFQFLRILRVSMTPKDSSAEPIQLINYERAEGASVGATLTVPSKNPVNILEQWKTDSAVFNLEIAGTLPEQAWSIDMSVHFVGKLSYKF